MYFTFWAQLHVSLESTHVPPGHPYNIPCYVVVVVVSRNPATPSRALSPLKGYHDDSTPSPPPPPT